MSVDDKIVNVKALKALKNYIVNLLSGKANTSHTHDDRYYTETEVDTALSGKANTSHMHDDRYYTETEADTLLDAKAAITDVQTRTATAKAYHLGFYYDNDGDLCQE